MDLLLKISRSAGMRRQDERTDLIQHLFALVTARLEDALIHTADGQGAKARRHAVILAPAIRREIDAAAALLAAIEAIELQPRA